ncbi:uncharacterized protein LOC128249827 [Octopus bimaculoides]|uniref:uncharacterized protein LOC128249827 n=1 Tax=Octopus bimaculoides TaxID=37653 RepID=UPI0022E0D2B3|nr:uncharacterized protein LOC128249827 [Octopus bimaculoides]
MKYSIFILLLIVDVALSIQCTHEASSKCASTYTTIDSTARFCKQYNNFAKCSRELGKYCRRFYDFVHFHKCVAGTTKKPKASSTRIGGKIESVFVTAVVSLILIQI